MKSAIRIICLLFITCLISCSYKKPTYMSQDLTKETWQSDVHTNPNTWVKGADRWFLNGDPSIPVEKDRYPTSSQAMTSMAVSVPNTFTSIKTDGAFEVQIFGCDRNSVHVYGPNEDVRAVEVSVLKDTLYISSQEDASPDTQHRVIVRVGVMNLKKLIQTGSGLVEARMVQSDGLTIVSNGQGNIYLSGNVNLQKVISLNKGSINVIGVYSPNLTINTEGKGCVNISGNLGVHNITHHGRGDINLIGVNSRELIIYGDGRGKIGLNGRFIASTITTKDSVAVLGYQVQGGCLIVDEYDSSRVGLAGYVNNLTVNTAGSSRFEGRNLVANDAYVRAKNSSHINVTARNKLFAVGKDNGSVYYYGTPAHLSKFVSGNGVVVPIWSNVPPVGCTTCGVYKDQPLH